jgi:lipid-binding SYLF domain-containing protein
MIKSIRIILCGSALSLVAGMALAQQPSTKFAHAVERSKDAGRIISLLSVLPEDSIPKELLEKAKAIAVFPKVERETIYFTHMIQGYGVISAQRDGAWTLPAFYQFRGAGYGNPFSEKDKYAVVMLFMNDETLTAFEKGGVQMKNENKSVAGPVGAIPAEQTKEIGDAGLLTYVYYNGKVKGVSYSKSFGLNPDNNINTPVYGMKGREVLTGKKIDPANLPVGISAYQEMLQKYLPVH